MNTSNKFKTLIWLASFILFLSIGVNIRCFLVINEMIEENLEQIVINYQLQNKIQKHLENKEFELAKSLLEKNIKQNGTMIGITTMSKNAKKLQKINEKLNP
jgi:hypothetical protein